MSERDAAGSGGVSHVSSDESFATWLATIAIHGAASHQRKDPHRLSCGSFATVVTPERSPEKSLPSAALDPEPLVLGAEARRALRAAVVALPSTYREVVILGGMKELTTSETARMLGISQQNVKMRLLRAKALLRTDLARRLGTCRWERRETCQWERREAAATPASVRRQAASMMRVRLRRWAGKVFASCT